MPEKELVHLEHRAGKAIAVLSLDNPPVNALSEQLRGQFVEKMGEAILNDAEVLVIRGAGKGFSAGADLNEILTALRAGEQAVREWLWQGHDFINLVADAPIHKIALIHGFAMGGGLELALACNARQVLVRATLGLPEATRGILPGWQGTIRIKKLLGYQAGREFYENGLSLPAHLAHRLGLVNGVCSSEEYFWRLVESALPRIPYYMRTDPAEHDESQEEIEAFLVKVRPPEEAIKTIEAFLNKKK